MTKMERNPITELVSRIERLEERYKRDKYADMWLMPRDLLIAVRDAVKSKKCDANPRVNGNGRPRLPQRFLIK